MWIPRGLLSSVLLYTWILSSNVLSPTIISLQSQKRVIRKWNLAAIGRAPQQYTGRALLLFIGRSDPTSKSSNDRFTIHELLERGRRSEKQKLMDDQVFETWTSRRCIEQCEACALPTVPTAHAGWSRHALFVVNVALLTEGLYMVFLPTQLSVCIEKIVNAKTNATRCDIDRTC